MLVIQSDTSSQCIAELHGGKIALMRANFVFSTSVTGNVTALFTKCYSSKNWGLAYLERLQTGLEIATNMVANATSFFSLANLNCCLIATLVTLILHDLEVQ